MAIGESQITIRLFLCFLFQSLMRFSDSAFRTHKQSISRVKKRVFDLFIASNGGLTFLSL